MPICSTHTDCFLIACTAGESFYFRVNGVPLYVQGANLVPLNILPTRVSADDLNTLLHSALRANMNMLRVW